MAEQMTPQYAALSNIESYVSTVEYEVAGLREAVNEALLQSARTGESADRKAIDRVLTLADLMDKAPDALTRAWARRVRNAVTGGSDG